MLNNKLIKKRINEYKLSIDSLYIEQKNNLNVLIDSNKLHELRSCSKLLVAIAMGIAIEQGLFSLNEKVYNYIEKFIYNENNKEKIKQWTIKTLLTHSTGYSKMIMSQKQILEEDLDKTKLHEYIFNYDIENEPNKEYVYNNVEPFTISILFSSKRPP